MQKELTIQQVQKKVDDYIGQFEEGYFQPFELLARFTEEVGELSREVQDVYGQKKKKSTESKNSIEEELGDLFFVLVCFANAEGIQLDKAIVNVIEKFETRDRDRWTRKEE